MATLQQERLAEAIVKNAKLPRDKRKGKGALLESVGYATTTAKHQPHVILEGKGVQEALESYGLTKDLITTALVADIKGKPKKRVKELALGAEILGMKTKPTDSTPTQNVTNHITQIIINPPSHAAEARNQSNPETISSVASIAE